MVMKYFKPRIIKNTFHQLRYLYFSKPKVCLNSYRKLPDLLFYDYLMQGYFLLVRFPKQPQIYKIQFAFDALFYRYWISGSFNMFSAMQC